jgi:hypothetical protein
MPLSNQPPRIAAVPPGTAAGSIIRHFARTSGTRVKVGRSKGKRAMTSKEQRNDKQPSDIRLLEDAELDHVFGGVNAGQVFLGAMATVAGAGLALGAVASAAL